jgi:hypothetical protein
LELETRVQFPCCSHLFFPADARPRRGTTHAREAQLQLREHPAAAARSIPTPLTHSLCVGTRATLRSPEERKVPQPFEEKAKKNRKQKTENRKQKTMVASVATNPGDPNKVRTTEPPHARPTHPRSRGVASQHAQPPRAGGVPQHKTHSRYHFFSFAHVFLMGTRPFSLERPQI